ncbi:hypothetical protein G7077_02070 [Sphingomonas piscis]|uniref:Uncharacterized protein n=1 Tax=Sphingomonas piscis TaxID=2714943 RepID=A0A6G7YMB1_9SPHN|nr:hypothetical protein [Sphingomonas piscis]QIK77878.1 hypothetical protein G7077_02070 [Sphingomonas piscis]
MLRSTLTMIALGFAAPAIAGSVKPVSIGSFEGQKFEYSTRLADADAVVIEGKFVRGDAFRFTVKPDGHVVGDVGSKEVAFRVSKKEADELAASLKTPQIAQNAPTFRSGSN